MEKLKTHCRNSLGKLKLFFKTQTHFETGTYNEKKKKTEQKISEMVARRCVLLKHAHEEKGQETMKANVRAARL